MEERGDMVAEKGEVFEDGVSERGRKKVRVCWLRV